MPQTSLQTGCNSEIALTVWRKFKSQVEANSKMGVGKELRKHPCPSLDSTSIPTSIPSQRSQRSLRPEMAPAGTAQECGNVA